MSRTPQQAVRGDDSSPGDVFKIIIGEVTEEIDNVEPGDIDIYNKNRQPWWILSLFVEISMGRRQYI